MMGDDLLSLFDGRPTSGSMFERAFQDVRMSMIAVMNRLFILLMDGVVVGTLTRPCAILHIIFSSRKTILLTGSGMSRY